MLPRIRSAAIAVLLTCLIYQPAKAQSGNDLGGSLDTRLMDHIYQMDGAISAGVFPVVSQTAYPMFLLIPAGVTTHAAIQGRYDKPLEIGSAMVLTYGVTRLLKSQLQRPRPYARYDHIEARSSRHQAYVEAPADAFPSGHVAMAATLATSLSLQYDSLMLRGAAGSWVGLIAVSRVWMGEHHPTDVLGGLLVGISSASAAHALNQWITIVPVHNSAGSGVSMAIAL